MSDRERRRRAVILVENLPVPFDRRVWIEAKTLRDDGWSVVVISPMGEDGTRWHEILEGIEVYRYPLWVPGPGLTAHLIEYAFAIPATLVLALLVRLRGRVDIVHACNPPDLLFPIGAVLKRAGASFVFDQHDLGPELYLAQGGRAGGLVHRLLLWAELHTYRAAAVVIGTNETYRDVAVGRGGVAPERAFVVRTSPDPARLHADTPDPRLKAGRRWMVTYLGTMGPQDGVELFVRAVSAVARRRPGEVHFCAIGSGDQLDDLRALTSRLGLDGDLEFTGRLSDAALRRYLATADVGVSPDPANGFNELCTMNKTLEYMSMGLPVAAFDLKETRASAADAGVYARPNDPEDLADKIISLLDDPELRTRMGRIGQERIAGALSWKVSAKHLLTAYATAVGADRPSRRIVDD